MNEIMSLVIDLVFDDQYSKQQNYHARLTVIPQ